MSLVGFKPKNHPQQTVSADVDDRAIRDEDFLPLHKRFGFTIDAAASSHNAKLPRYWTAQDDALHQAWGNERVWCNPPYSRQLLIAFVGKAWHEWDSEWPPQCIVMLLPANRTEQAWWQAMVEQWLRERRSDFRVEFLPGRMRFDRPSAVIGPKGDRPPFGCCLLIWERQLPIWDRTGYEAASGACDCTCGSPSHGGFCS